MGNFCARFAFKPGEDEEPKHERYRLRKNASSLDITAYKKSSEVQTDDEIVRLFDEGMRELGSIFEPLPLNSNGQDRIEANVLVGPTKLEGLKTATKEGILNAMNELERELNLHYNWLDKSILQATVDEKAEGTEAPKQEQEQVKPTQQVRKKAIKHKFFKKQAKAKKRRVSFKNPTESNDDAPNMIESEREIGFNFDSPPAKADKKVVKRKVLVKPNYRFKIAANSRKRNKIGDAKSQNH